MTTKNIVPRATGEGSLGTAAKKWGNIYADYITLADGETLQTKIANQNTRITTAEGTVTTLSGDVTTLYGSVETLSSGKVSVTEYAKEIGMVFAFAGATCPSGYLFCDGSAISRTDYAKLFAVIGTSYGVGDGSTTFNLPNLVDKFIQGNANVGTVKSAGLPNIIGTSSWYPNGEDNALHFTYAGAYGYENTSIPAGKVYFSGGVGTGKRLNFDASKGEVHNGSYSNLVYGKSETVQPPAVTMQYIIRYE